eukprot:TRINITY_DN2001_c0_g1::TRINITY_DN2001_c0_g1_i1::g.22986::m.22986 TRINITY_DN2001_c0_g1::TRINITY_DN2001_c0_g1_i1::g.22986  ORF type:complete len:736 (-),score=71.96,GAF_3/PF13492.1/7.1e-05,GAF/PF01590.21/0.028,GAF/PF01590.21/1.8e+03,zf-CHC2/PF01807.15/0.26,zf-CHC2/PF01807.15/1e+04 TRINITY_DN2001_c0_g1_i1:258-2465(-)
MTNAQVGAPPFSHPFSNTTEPITDTSALALIFEISTSFTSLSQECLERGIRDALKKLAKHIGADRAFIYRVQDDKFCSVKYEWHSEKYSPLQQKNSRYDIQGFSSITNTLMNNHIVHVIDRDSHPHQDSLEISQMIELDLHSMIASSLVIYEQMWGYLGFGCGSAGSSQWRIQNREAVSFMRVASAVIASAIAKKEAEKLIQRTRVLSHEALLTNEESSKSTIVTHEAYLEVTRAVAAENIIIYASTSETATAVGRSFRFYGCLKCEYLSNKRSNARRHAVRCTDSALAHCYICKATPPRSHNSFYAAHIMDKHRYRTVQVAVKHISAVGGITSTVFLGLVRDNDREGGGNNAAGAGGAARGGKTNSTSPTLGSQGDYSDENDSVSSLDTASLDVPFNANTTPYHLENMANSFSGPDLLGSGASAAHILNSSSAGTQMLSPRQASGRSPSMLPSPNMNNDLSNSRSPTLHHSPNNDSHSQCWSAGVNLASPIRTSSTLSTLSSFSTPSANQSPPTRLHSPSGLQQGQQLYQHHHQYQNVHSTSTSHNGSVVRPQQSQQQQQHVPMYRPMSSQQAVTGLVDVTVPALSSTMLLPMQGGMNPGSGWVPSRMMEDDTHVMAQLMSTIYPSQNPQSQRRKTPPLHHLLPPSLHQQNHPLTHDLSSVTTSDPFLASSSSTHSSAAANVLPHALAAFRKAGPSVSPTLAATHSLSQSHSNSRSHGSSTTRTISGVYIQDRL